MQQIVRHHLNGHMPQHRAQFGNTGVFVQPVAAQKEPVPRARVAAYLVKLQVTAHANGPRDGVGLRVFFGLIPGQLPSLHQRCNQRMVRRQHLDLVVTQAVKAAVPGPQRPEMPVGQNQCNDRRPHRRAADFGFSDDRLVGLLNGPSDVAQLVLWSHVLRQNGNAVDDGPAGEIAAFVPAHSIRNNPDLLVRQNKDGILVDFAHPTDMGFGVKPDLTRGHAICPIVAKSIPVLPDRSNRAVATTSRGKPLVRIIFAAPSMVADHAQARCS